MKLRFTWDGEAGQISRADIHAIENAVAGGDWITAADFLKDVVHEATSLYNEIVAHPLGQNPAERVGSFE